MHVSEIHAPRSTRLVLEEVGRLLDRDVCWLYQRRYHFTLDDDGRTLAVSEETGGRFRLEACKWARPVATLWTLSGDPARLASVVRELKQGDAVGV